MKYTKLVLFTLGVFAALALMTPVRAGGPVPYRVTDCSNDTQLQTYLGYLQSGEGGLVEFSCGTATILVADQLPSIEKAVIVDGDNKITLDGNNAHRLFLVLATGKLTLKNIVLEKGYTEDNSGGALHNRGSLILNRVTIRNSQTPENGGAISNYGTLEITDSALTNNTAGNGGAIYGDDFSYDHIKITNTKFYDNIAANSKMGGAIYTLGAVDILKSEFARNKAGSGGAVYVNSSSGGSTITESYFHDNQTTGQDPYGKGGALATVLDSPVTIAKSTFQKNTARLGGAMYIDYYAKSTVTDTTFADNHSTSGGGIYNDGRITMLSVTLARNIASVSGGGIENANALSMTNVTVSGNQGAQGGGLKNKLDLAVATLTNVTFSGNSGASTSAGGILNEGAYARLSLQNVLMGKGPSGKNCLFTEPVTSSTSNLSNDTTCSFGAGRDNVDLKLGPLANNGGPTQTHMPQPGSPAIDKGTAVSGLDIDQRGIIRPLGPAYDVGAVEVLYPPTPTPTKTLTPTSTPTKTPTASPTLTSTLTHTPTQPTCTGKPAKPILRKPKNGNQITRLTVNLNWEDAACAQKYKVLIRIGSSKGSWFQKKSGLTLSEFRTNPLPKGQTYFWRVSAINSAGKTKSDWRTFKTE